MTLNELISVNLLYYGVTVLMYFKFVLLAVKWKELIYHWENNEWLLLQEIDETYTATKLKRTTWLMALASFIVGIILQILWEVTVFYHTTECWGFKSRMHAYFNNSFPELFALIPYSKALGICAFIVSLICEISRIYLDVFLTTICLALREQFQILNYRILNTSTSVSLQRLLSPLL